MNKIEKIQLKSDENVIDFLECHTSEITIENEVNSNCLLLLSNLQVVDKLIIDINEGSSLVLSVLLDKEISNYKNLNLVINVKSHALLKAFFAEFSSNNLQMNCVINLLNEGANAVVKLASLSANNDDKNISISINHISGKTYGKVDNYGVCKDNGKLLFAGTSHIFEKASKSKTQQNAKIMVFDEASNAIAKPILKIDENDVEASHAAVVGKINDEHLFYLTSRGLSEADAKQLITFGYLKPILQGFNDEKTRAYISSLIERRM